MFEIAIEIRADLICGCEASVLVPASITVDGLPGTVRVAGEGAETIKEDASSSSMQMRAACKAAVDREGA